jgi:type IV pilus assembly protein PilP
MSALLLAGSAVFAQEKTTAAQKTVADRTVPPPQSPGKSASARSDSTATNAAPPATDASGSAPVDKNVEPPPTPRLSGPGRRDPFRPFTSTTRAGIRRRDNLTPLERYELGQLKLVGIIWDVKDPNAIVEDSAGLGYIVRVGTPIGANDGKVKLIKPGEIVVEETHVDIYGARKRREVSMQLHLEKAQ